jgi:hypothetical protein
MMSCKLLPCPHGPITDTLHLRRAGSIDELEDVLDLHASAFGPRGAILRTRMQANLCARPGSRPDDVFYVRDIESGLVASSVSLIRQQWSYEGIPIPVGEVGIVSTREAYRNRGLVRHQFAAFARLALQQGCVMSVIAGIPYFYRQFGYDFILPLGGGINLPAAAVPEAPEGQAPRYTLRQATPADMPMLLGFYSAMVEGQCVGSVMTPEIWCYQDGVAEDSPERLITYVIERDGDGVGYVRAMANEDSNGYVITSAYAPTRDMCLEVLRYARRIALEQRCDPKIGLGVAMDTPLAQVAEALGGERRRAYAWQVRILDPIRFLYLIGPALERRLAASSWAGLTRDWSINLYTTRLLMRFRDGKLMQVTTSPRDTQHDLSCPAEAMPAIWLGYRSVGEVLDWYADAACRNTESRQLADVLFPKRPSWIQWLF